MRISGGSWAQWQRENAEITTPHSLEWLERDGTLDSFRRLDPSALNPSPRRGLSFTDSDLYKALEGMSWDLVRGTAGDSNLVLNELIKLVGRAQAADGYINSYVQAGESDRWVNLAQSHELYCIGHLIQAGIAHQRSTESSDLLEIAIKAADHVVAEFGDNRRLDLDGHEEVEMALVELYRETGNQSYLDLAKQFIDGRGHGAIPTDGEFDGPYYQDATPFRSETTTVGHAVRALYLLAGVVDLYIETGEDALLHAALQQWDSMNSSKTYLTGAVGSRFIGEAFGDSYELPPDLVYGETCATIGNVMASWRLLLVTGDSRFADAIERALYNLISASTSIERTAFFYNNPAQRRTPLPAAPTDGRPDRADAPGTRPQWYSCACCPPNIMRMIASLSAYLATHSGDGIQIHQYMPSEAHISGTFGEVALSVETEYPLDGRVTLTISESPATKWTLSLRQPDWADSVSLFVNGDLVPSVRSARGYLDISRVWKAGDSIELRLPMEPRLTAPHPAADALRGTVAVERGPVVYTLESHDQADGIDLNHVELHVTRPLSEVGRDNFLGRNVPVILAHGRLRNDEDWNGKGWRSYTDTGESKGRDLELVFIPYALWANRGPSSMRVFVPISSDK